MAVIPAFILRRLYVKGSLRTTDGGFKFELRNSLGSGYAKALHPLIVDGEELSIERSFFTLDDRTVAFAEVDETNTFGLPMNRSIVISAEAPALEAGPHKIGMSFTVPGFGKLGFDFTDEVDG